MSNQDDLRSKLLKHLQANPSISFSAQKLASAIGMSDASGFTPVVQTLAALERDGQVKVTDQGEFQAVVKKAAKNFTGTFHGNDKGFGFVDYDPDLPDIYVNPDHTLHALTGDIVEVKILRAGDPSGDRGPEGQVTKIVEHHYTQVVGEFKQETIGNYIGEVLLKDKKISKYRFFVTDEGLHPVDGNVITATVKTYPDDESPEVMTGPATKVIGNKDEPGIDILSVVYAHNVPSEFPEEVMEEAKKIPLSVQPEERKGRKDITNQPVVTVDAIESKDLDDAVVAWKMPNGHYHLGVHIADVTHYVKAGTALEKEAYKRGTSVYLTDRVVPMLPKRLSNGICSLNPNEDRLAMSCEMEIDDRGHVVNHKIFPSIIRSHARMTYKAINAILTDHDPKVTAQYKDLVPMFKTMAELHKILLDMRHRRGAIDFDTPEAKIVVDDTGKPLDIQLRQRGLAERMIESFMLAANETVAEHYYKLHVPFLYRVHEEPEHDRMQDFFDFLTAIGVEVHGSSKKVTPKMLQGVLKQVEGQPEEPMVQMMMLRSMQQARYSNEELGHFGLAAPYYTHFTSPIRRYPDEMVHRMIRYYGEHGTGEQSKKQFRDRLEEIGDHTSATERRGIDTERDVDSMKKAEYMADHVGETFEATVSSVMKFGLFVQLPNTVEGLVHISAMQDDYYEYLDSHLALIGRHTHRIFQIGQPVTVRLIRVDKDQREVDFELVHPENAPKTKLRVPHTSRGGFGHGRGHGHGRNNHGHGRPNDHQQAHGKHSHGRNNHRGHGHGHNQRHNGNRNHDNFEIRHRDDESGRHNESRNRHQINRDAAGGLHSPRRGFRQHERRR